LRLAIDHSAEPIAVFRANFPTEKTRIRQEDVGRVFDGAQGRRLSGAERYWRGRIGALDLVVAGPPCQGHSDLNNSTRRKDPRNSLYLRVVRAVEVLRPKAVIVENVPTILLDKGKVVDRAVKWLQGLGYSVSNDIVRLNRLRIPQLRKRHLLVATTGQVGFNLGELSDMDRGTPTVGDYLAGLEDEPSRCAGLLFCPSTPTEANRKRIDYLFDNDIYDLPDSRRPVCHREKEHAYVSMYGRMHWDKPAQTLTSGFGSMGQGRFVHPTRRRLLTPHEAARLQGFPDFFDFSAAQGVTALREMIANAVPPQALGELVGRFIDKGII
jgi:DNA (cytosine-5)-methyltransferase 1